MTFRVGDATLTSTRCATLHQPSPQRQIRPYPNETRPGHLFGPLQTWMLIWVKPCFYRAFIGLLGASYTENRSVDQKYIVGSQALWLVLHSITLNIPSYQQYEGNLVSP